MIVFDTDHLSVLRGKPSARRDRLIEKMTTAIGEQFATTIISVEEQMRGWLATIAKERQSQRWVRPYDELASLFDFFSNWMILRFDLAAAALFDSYSRIRIGSSDRKIASIAIARNALLLTANQRDFELIPGLRFANWLDGTPSIEE